MQYIITPLRAVVEIVTAHLLMLVLPFLLLYWEFKSWRNTTGR